MEYPVNKENSMQATEELRGVVEVGNEPVLEAVSEVHWELT